MGAPSKIEEGSFDFTVACGDQSGPAGESDIYCKWEGLDECTFVFDIAESSFRSGCPEGENSAEAGRLGGLPLCQLSYSRPPVGQFTLGKIA